jgi:hypothetical protein
MRALLLAFIFPRDRRLMMNRNLIAGLFAVAILPATAFAAHAADQKLHRQLPLERIYQLACKIGSDGESLQIRMNVRNTSDRVIPRGDADPGDGPHALLRGRTGKRHPAPPASPSPPR